MRAATPQETELEAAPVLQRARGRIRAVIRRALAAGSHAAELFQEGCLKVRLPRPARAGEAELVMINTAGGLTGGDRLSVGVTVGESACAIVTTPACERIYRSIGGEAVIDQRLRVGRGARLDWIPQETILFNRSRLRRRLEISLEADAEITTVETVLLGRTAMGETVNEGFLSDLLTIRRGANLLFADATRIAEPFDCVAAGSATLRARNAMATLVQVGRNLEAKRDTLRAGFSGSGEVTAGASVVGGVLIARIVAPSGRALRRALIPALISLRDQRPLPRLWHC